MDFNLKNLIDTPTEQNLLNSLSLRDSDTISKFPSITLIEKYLNNQKDVNNNVIETNIYNTQDSLDTQNTEQSFDSFFETDLSKKQRGRKKSVYINKKESSDECMMRFGNRYVEKNSVDYLICRRRNNAAVKKTRKRNFMKEKNINMLIDIVKKENLTLRDTIDNLKKEIDHLRNSEGSISKI
jgi:hypothetical protein